MAVAILTSLLKRFTFLIPQASSSTATGPPSSAEQELRKLEITMQRIHAMLEDAEEKDLSNETERLRLKELKEVACDAEDAVDEYEYEVLRVQVEARRQAMANRAGRLKDDDEVFDWNSRRPLKVPVSDELARRVKRISERFDEVTNEWNRISWPEKFSKKPRINKWKPVETTSSIDMNTTFGREGEKEKIIEWLLRGNDHSEGRVSVLPVVGMGGLGKTTLAKMVYNDSRVCQHFDLRGWICVYEEFDIGSLMKKVYTSFYMWLDNNMSLNMLSETLEKRLNGKKFFLVLDDVWNENCELWNSLKTLLVHAEVGKILVTTRNESVAKTMHTTPPIKLSILSFENCWLLFSKIAFGARSRDLHLNLFEIGKKIVNKCRGLPLAVKVLAGVLSVEYDEEAWIAVEESELWELDEENEGILAPLKLSYNHMPTELRPCFMYLSLFPKDYPLEQPTIVQQWMAHGFIQPDGERMEEDIGNDYFNELLHRSILQRHIDYPYSFAMHDLIHDLAQDVAKDEYLMISTDKLHHIIPETVRHVTVLVKENCEIKELMPLFESKLRLRTLMLHSVMGFPTKDLMPKLMHIMMNLRTLCFVRQGMFANSIRNKEINLGFIGTLKHLRYLGLEDMDIHDIPESVYKLYHLRTLMLGNNTLNLPTGIGDLVNLRHLSGFTWFIDLPHEVGWLAELRTLGEFVVGPGTLQCKVRHLKDLNNLRGQVRVHGLDTVVPSDFNPSEAYLENKTGIVDLQLLWYDGFSDAADCDEKLAEQVLDCLRPHPNITTLSIHRYPGAILPTWLGSLSKLEALTLEHCCNSTSLPTVLGQLSRLKYLDISRMERVKSVGRELLCYDSSPVAANANANAEADAETSCFSSLEVLNFREMEELEEWHGVEDSDFPRLRQLCIGYCPKLRRLPSLSSLSMLKIVSCPELRLTSLPSLTVLELGTEWNSEVISGTCTPMLRVVDIANYPVETLVFPHNHNLHSLEELAIGSSSELRSVGGLANLTSLRHLKIYKCPNLQISPDERLPPNLQDVNINKAPGAEKWYQHQVLNDQSCM